MNVPSRLFMILCTLLLASCANSPKRDANQHLANESLTGRLSQNHGYKVDEQGNWIPRNNKRSQYEGLGGKSYFNGDLHKKAFQAQTLSKGSWIGEQRLKKPEHHLNGAESAVGVISPFNSQQANLEHRLQTPAKIAGNHLPTDVARETGAGAITRPSDAETDFRRRVFQQPDVVDYKKQRELSIEQSKRLLGREN